MENNLLPNDIELLEEFHQKILMCDYQSATLNLRRLLESIIFEIYNIQIKKRTNETFSTMCDLIINFINDDFEKELVLNSKHLYSHLSKALHFYEVEISDERFISEILIENGNNIYFLIKLKNKYLYKKNYSINEIAPNIPKELLYVKNNSKFQIMSFKKIIENYKIKIPLYQRNYVWDIKMIMTFLKTPKTISTLYFSLDPNLNKDAYVVDGQQRIRTIILFIKYFIEKNKIDQSDEENELFNEYDLDFIYDKFFKKNLFEKFDSIEKNEQYNLFKNLLDKPFMIQFVEWDKQVENFYSLNFSSKSISRSELLFSYLISDLDLERQKIFSDNLSNFSGEILMGKKFRDFDLWKENSKVAFRNNLNIEAICDLGKIDISPDIKINNNIRNKFNIAISKLTTFSNLMDSNAIWNNIQPKIKKEEGKNSNEISNEYLGNFDNYFTSDCTNNYPWFKNLILLIKHTIWNNYTLEKIKSNKEKDFDFNESSHEVAKFVYSLLQISDGKVWPSKKLINNKEILLNFITNFLICTNVLDIQMNKNLFGKEFGFGNVDKLEKNWNIIIFNLMKKTSDDDFDYSKMEDIINEYNKGEINYETPSNANINIAYGVKQMNEINKNHKKIFEMEKNSKIITALGNEDLIVSANKLSSEKIKYSKYIFRYGNDARSVINSYSQIFIYYEDNNDFEEVLWHIGLPFDENDYDLDILEKIKKQMNSKNINKFALFNSYEDFYEIATSENWKYEFERRMIDAFEKMFKE